MGLFFRLSSFCLSNCFAFFARTPIFTVFSSVFWCKFMPPFAVCFRFVSRAISKTSKGKPFFINMLFFGKNFFNIPSKINSLINSWVCNTNLISPFHSGLSFSVKFYKMVVSSIALLLRSCRPSAIFRTIIPIWVNSIYTHVWLWMPHVFKKISKTAPSFAYFNSATTIILVCLIFGIIASLSNSKPDSLYSSAVKSVSVYSFNHSKNLSLLDNGTEWRRSQT